MIPDRSFFIVTPCDDGHKYCFWESLRMFEKLYYARQLPTKHRFETFTMTGDSLVPRARDNIAWSFLKQTRHDYLVSIDSDLDFRPDDLLRLTDLAAANDYDLLCGMYAIKQDDLRWCINALPGKVPDPVTGVQEIAMAPGGLNLVHRRVFERMIREANTWPHWRVEFTEDHTLRDQWHFYFDGVVFDLEAFPDKHRGRYLSEDWGFSYFARKLGFKIWLDTKTIALHCGTALYPKQARRLTQAEAEAKEISQPDGSRTALVSPQKV